MGAHLPITIDASAPDMSVAVFAGAAERIRHALRLSERGAVAQQVVEVVERISGERIRDQKQLARQMLLWHATCPPDRAHALIVAALADRAGALRRSALRRRLARGAIE